MHSVLQAHSQDLEGGSDHTNSVISDTLTGGKAFPRPMGSKDLPQGIYCIRQLQVWGRESYQNVFPTNREFGGFFFFLALESLGWVWTSKPSFPFPGWGCYVLGVLSPVLCMCASLFSLGVDIKE